MTPLHRPAMADPAAEPSPARAPAAVFEIPLELRAASPSTSDIVVMGLEGWEGARSAEGPAARFRAFCIAALCLPARLFLHVPITCVATRPSMAGRRSFCHLRLPSAAAAAVLAARRRLCGAHCPVSLDVPRTRVERLALRSLRSQMGAGRADQPPSRADAAPSWRAAGAPVEPQGIAFAPLPTPAAAPLPAPIQPTLTAAPPAALLAAVPARPPASIPAHAPAAAPPAPPVPTALPAGGTVVGITATKGRGKLVRYLARVIAAGVEGECWLPASEIPPTVLIAWRRQRSRDQCRASRQRTTASQQQQPPPPVQQSANQQRPQTAPVPAAGTRRSLRLTASA